MGKPKSVRVRAFEQACQRYFSRLFLHWGLHPLQAEAISLGIDWPYRLRTFCWTIYQKTGGGSSCVPVYSILAEDGTPRDPIIEVDLPRLIRGHHTRHLKGKVNEQSLEKWHREQLGKPDQSELDKKAEAQMLDYAMQEAKPYLDYAIRKDEDVLHKLMAVAP